MKTKICTKCQKELPAKSEYFHRAEDGKYGLRAACKECLSFWHQEYYKKNKEKYRRHKKKYYYENQEKVLAAARKYTRDNRDSIAQRRKTHNVDREKVLAAQRRYFERNKEKVRARARQFYRDNKEKCYEKQKRYMKNSLNARLAARLRGRVNDVIKYNRRGGSAVKDLGCSLDELKIHLESQFQEGMTWENYGDWHIDHIIPLSSFDLSDRKQFLKACHYTNLQPLWARDNLIKANKVEG